MDYFDALYAALGPQHWWPSSPAGGPFEVIVGAILTQSTAWTNVERAIANLRRERLLTPRAIERVPLPRLAHMVRPSGYFRQKAKKLKAFVGFLRREFGGSLARMFRTPTERLRPMLLEVFGIGPETADSILLYAGNHPVFVVDAYTRRVLERHGWIQATRIEILKSKSGCKSSPQTPLPSGGESRFSLECGSEAPALFTLPPHSQLPPDSQIAAKTEERRSLRLQDKAASALPHSIGVLRAGATYEEIRALFESRLPHDAQLYNEYHALLVHVGKYWCRPREPKCDVCPLREFLPNTATKIENRKTKSGLKNITQATGLFSAVDSCFSILGSRAK